MNRKSLFFALSLLLVFSCKTAKQIPEVKDDGKLTFKFIQLSDVYEIAPLGGGKYGGMARVAHVVDSIREVEPNTFLFMAGDFLNPSLLGTIKLDGERIRGKQMIEVMNAMEFELVTFGNHEFDLKEEDLQKRMDESNFYWISANVFQNNDDGPRSFFFRRNNDTIYVPETYSITMMDSDSTQIEVGLFGLTIPLNPQDYVYYADIDLEANSAYTRLQLQRVDMIIGLTHLDIDDDVKLSNRFPEIAMIMGGHDHHNMLVTTDNGIVAKADANAKTIYVHTITYDKGMKKAKIDSHLMTIDDRTPTKPEVKEIVNKWNKVLEDKLKEIVTNPYEVIYTAETPLDGMDTASRSKQTNLGEVITHAMAVSFNTEIEAAIVNGGSFRLDDKLVGDVTSLDIFRVLPFGGSVVKVAMKGRLLKEVLDYGDSNPGKGAYLQRFNITENEQGEWLLNFTKIENENVYTIAVSDFLLKGFDIPFLTAENEGVISVQEPTAIEAASDIRKAVILFLKSLNAER
jgi:5'-nucleotidase / UDP-sugar diphosphatase